MYHSNGPDYSPNFVLSSEIFEGLEEAMPPTSNTSYLVNPAFPGVFVKATRPGGSRADAEIADLRADFLAYHDMEVPGLRVVPFSVLQFAGELALVVHRVDGVNLSDELIKNPVALAEYDRMYANQIAKTAALRGQNRLYPSDIYGPHQFMWGTLWGSEDKPGIIFVDVESSGDFIRNLKTLRNIGHYMYELANMVITLNDVHSNLGSDLPLARAQFLEEVKKNRSSMINAGRAEGYKELHDAACDFDNTALDEWF